MLSLKGYLTRKELELALVGAGEPFSSDEFDEMWTAIKVLRLSAEERSTLPMPPDSFDYVQFTKFIMKWNARLLQFII